MPSSIRGTFRNTVAIFRSLQAGLKSRRCDELLLTKAAEHIVRSSETLDDGVARLDPATAARATESVRAAIAELGAQALQGDAQGVSDIRDPVGRLICERQLPIAYTTHLLAAVILGAEQGMRCIVLGFEQERVAPPAPAKRPARGGLARQPRTTDHAVEASAASPSPGTSPVSPSDRLLEPPPAEPGSISGRQQTTPDTEDL